MVKMVLGNYYLDKNGKKTGPLILNNNKNTKNIWPYRISPTNNQLYDWYVKENGFVNYGTGRTDQLSEYISTGFEVGKKYKLISTGYLVEVLHSHGEENWLKNELGKTFIVHDRDFLYYEEYIPPPPGEWRIVYKDRYGNVTVGKTSFKSESEARASHYWTDHKSSAFKTIRVDA